MYHTRESQTNSYNLMLQQNLKMQHAYYETQCTSNIFSVERQYHENVHILFLPKLAQINKLINLKEPEGHFRKTSTLALLYRL